MYLMRDLHPEYIKNAYNSTINKEITQLKKSEGFE